jgi:hypothetical protein
MNEITLKKLTLLYIIPLIFLIYYLTILFFNNLETNQIFYNGLSGSELIIIGIVGILECMVEIYFYRPNVSDDYKIKILDREFIYSLICLIVFLAFYIILKFISTNELMSINTESGPSDILRNACHASLVLGVTVIIWGIRTIKILKRTI